MESLVTWFAATLGPYISEKAVVFLISMMPLLELRGGLLASSLLKVSAVQAIPICIIGNILPIPFILLVYQKDLPVDEESKMLPRTDHQTGKSGDGKKRQDPAV